MSIIGKLFKKQDERETLRRNAVEAFATLERMEKKGLILWEQKERRLFIAEPLATLMIKSEKRWKNFLQNVGYWQMYCCQQEAWDNYMRNEELKAVRKAKKTYAVLTKTDMERTRRKRRNEIAIEEVPVPEIKPFELFIIGDSYEGPVSEITKEKTDRAKKTRNAENHIIAVGEFNPMTGHLCMTLWKDVQNALKDMDNVEKEDTHSDIELLEARIKEI